jgi:hypothetical protein
VSGKYRRIVGLTDEVLDAVNDYIQFGHEGRDIPQRRSELLGEENLLEPCGFDECA